MKKIKIFQLNPCTKGLLEGHLDFSKFSNGGVMFYKPGELSFPNVVHVHEVEEVFLYFQGKGNVIIDNVEYPVQAGDVVIVEAGEEHHTRSSTEDPLVVVWLETSK